jgi:hypothetical protein
MVNGPAVPLRSALAGKPDAVIVEIEVLGSQCRASNGPSEAILSASCGESSATPARPFAQPGMQLGEGLD